MRNYPHQFYFYEIMKKTVLIIIAFVFVFNSCSIRGNFKGLYSYYYKTKKESPDLFIESSTNICNLKYSKNIYIINGKVLKNCLRNEDKSLVYIWGAKCSSKICIPLNSLQEYCDKNNIALYVVAEYYDSEQMKKEYNMNKPILGIDTEYYKTNLTKKYLDAFMNDIAGKNYSNKRYIYFEKGQLKDIQEEINL